MLHGRRLGITRLGRRHPGSLTLTQDERQMEAGQVPTL